MNMTKPLIGITAGEIINKERPLAPVTYGQTHTYIDSIIKSGGIPIILPLTTDIDTLAQLANKLDGLVLAGGNDVNPERYNEQPYATTGFTSDLRDDTEYTLLKLALKQNIPVLAICRGMQLLNVYNGGTLYQHIPHDLDTSVAHQVIDPNDDPLHTAHSITIQADTKLHSILQADVVSVNSYHHQAIKELGSNLQITARCTEDGIIEGIETTDDRFIVGIQCHPESITEAVPNWKLLFDEFIHRSSETKIAASH